MDFADRLRALRTARGLSQEDVARAVGVSANVPGLWERGRQHPAYAALAGLVVVLDTTGDYLLGVTDDPGPHWRDHPAFTGAAALLAAASREAENGPPNTGRPSGPPGGRPA